MNFRMGLHLVRGKQSTCRFVWISIIIIIIVIINVITIPYCLVNGFTFRNNNNYRNGDIIVVKQRQQ